MSNTNEPEVDAGIVVNPNSEYAKEMRKWEMFPSIYGKTPGRPYDVVKREYPRMLYRAQKLPNGKYSAGEVYPTPHQFAKDTEYERAMLVVDGFNKSCQRTVANDDDLNAAKADGWRITATEALAHAESLEQDIARAAAETAFHARGMSATAQRELKEASDATHEHVTDVSKRRGASA